MPDQALTCVFWDVGDSPVPEEFLEDPCLLYCRFQSALNEKGYHGELSFRCYSEKTSLSDDLLLKYQNAKFTLHAEGGKDNRVRWMVYDILLWAMDHPVPYPEPANLIVISNNIFQDEEFYGCVSALRARDYNVILVQQPDNDEAQAQGSVWPASLLERGEPVDLTKDY